MVCIHLHSNWKGSFVPQTTGLMHKLCIIVYTCDEDGHDNDY